MKGYQPLKDGEPCEHPGCMNHISHPCEGCGRIAGINQIGTPPKNPGRDTSKDAEIKMQMAKDILCHRIITRKANDSAASITKDCCDTAEQIFNRFHKGDE